MLISGDVVETVDYVLTFKYHRHFGVSALNYASTYNVKKCLFPSVFSASDDLTVAILT